MFRGMLYDHQRNAVEELKSGSILCGGVGSGKSITALAYFFEKECGGDLSPDSEWDCMKTPKDLYIITTAKKRDDEDWRKEANLFMLDTDNDLNPNDIYFWVDSWNNIKKYTNVKDAFFIFDEQRVSGTGVWVKSFLKIAKNNSWILLSATPADTWSDYIPVFIANGFYKNRTEFLNEHAVYHPYIEHCIKGYKNCKKLVEFEKKILVRMDYDRLTVSHHEDIFCDFDIVTYRDVMRRRWDPFKNEPIQNAAGLCHILRKVVNSDPSRIQFVYDLYIEKKKVIVFYNFDYELFSLRKLCEDAGIPYGEWNGHRHDDIPDSSDWLYLVQYSAGAEGWNCIVTDTIVFFSQNYSYKVMTQAAGRIDRLDTSFIDLYYYHLTSSSTIDKSISAAIKSKRKFNERKFAKM